VFTTVTTVDVELGPLERSCGVAYIGDAQLDDGPLPLGAHFALRDEGGLCHDATVLAVEQGRYGRRYRVSFVEAV